MENPSFRFWKASPEVNLLLSFSDSAPPPCFASRLLHTLQFELFYMKALSIPSHLLSIDTFCSSFSYSF